MSSDPREPATDPAAEDSAVDPADFERLAGPLRPELLAHCYRMLGSVHEAEDQVQETYLRAWKAFHSFAGRSSVRTWMYRIATNTCLTALERAGRRPLPTGLGAPAEDPSRPLTQDREIPWLEPLPDRMVRGDGLVGAPPSDTEGVTVRRESVRLAGIAALQDLAPNQRATLVLRDVLGFSAAETADMLGTSVASCNSALQRARERVGDGLDDGRCASDLTPQEREVWEGFCRAFEAYDVPAVVELFAADATWQMPPFTGWYRGRADIGALFEAQCPASGPMDLRMVPTTCNGMPAAGMYLRTPDGGYEPFQLDVLDIVDGQIRAAVAFFDLSIFPLAGLPTRLESD